MGDPQLTYPTIHVAGTNGKTTVTRMVQQILGAHGLTTAGFTSPHLTTIEERFMVHGEIADADTFAGGVRDIAWFVTSYEAEHDTTITYFELTVAIAATIFANAAVDVAVFEVGLGGRLDATNVLDADVSVITGIDIDHTEFLGSTVREIAGEKMAIVKDGGVMVTGRLPADAEEVAAARAEAVGANWIRSGRDYDVVGAEVAVGGWHCSIDGVFGEYEDLYLPVHGRHQVDNLATAIATAEMFIGRTLDPESVRFAVGSMSTPGRLEVVRRRPVVLVDGAHNTQGFQGLSTTLNEEFPTMPWKLVLGVRGERSIEQLVAPLRGIVDSVFAAAADDPAAVDPQVVASLAGSTLGVGAVAYDSPALALAEAIDAAGPEGGVVVAGSLYLAGDLREVYRTGDDRSVEAHLRFEPEVDLGDLDEGDLPIDLDD